VPIRGAALSLPHSPESIFSQLLHRFERGPHSLFARCTYSHSLPHATHVVHSFSGSLIRRMLTVHVQSPSQSAPPPPPIARKRIALLLVVLGLSMACFNVVLCLQSSLIIANTYLSLTGLIDGYTSTFQPTGASPRDSSLQQGQNWDEHQVKPS